MTNVQTFADCVSIFSLWGSSSWSACFSQHVLKGPKKAARKSLDFLYCCFREQRELCLAEERFGLERLKTNQRSLSAIALKRLAAAASSASLLLAFSLPTTSKCIIFKKLRNFDIHYRKVALSWFASRTALVFFSTSYISSENIGEEHGKRIT